MVLAAHSQDCSLTLQVFLRAALNNSLLTFKVSKVDYNNEIGICLDFSTSHIETAP